MQANVPFGKGYVLEETLLDVPITSEKYSKLKKALEKSKIEHPRIEAHGMLEFSLQKSSKIDIPIGRY